MHIHKSGFISILGRPNVGKSSFVNKVLNEKISIVVDKPQTTRNEIKGIYNEKDYQIIFLDTPGFHKGKNELDKFMNHKALNAVKGADIVLFFSCADDNKIHSLDKALIEIIEHRKLKPYLVLTKTDLCTREVVENRIEEFNQLHKFAKVFPVSTVTGEGIESLINEIKNHLPIQPAFYEKDMMTDYTNAFSISEIIREKALLVLNEEVPHSIGVLIEEKDYDPVEGVFIIKAAIVVERDSQKAIVIGAGGKKIKEIGTLARQELLNAYDSKIYLELFVKVEQNWRKSLFKVKEMGYDK